jgi:hypothetical protein
MRAALRNMRQQCAYTSMRHTPTLYTLRLHTYTPPLASNQ